MPMDNVVRKMMALSFARNHTLRLKTCSVLFVIVVLAPLWLVPFSGPVSLSTVGVMPHNEATQPALYDDRVKIPLVNDPQEENILASPIPDNVNSNFESKRKSIVSKDDVTTTLFLQTDWKSKVETQSEVQITNGTKKNVQQHNIPNEVPPLQKGENVKNESRFVTPSATSVQDTTEVLITTSGYFSGHTWSWEYGSDDRHLEAPVMIRPLEGNWFPQAAYSRITYQDLIYPFSKIVFRIERGADTYARRIRLYCGNYMLLDDVIESSEQYYEATILTNNIPMGSYFVTLEINYGGYKYRGWSLRYWQVFYRDSEGYYQPMRTGFQQFQKERSSTLEFRVPMGPHTILNIETQNCHDIFTRYLYVYVDGVHRKTLYAPGAYEIEIANFATPGLHDLKLVLYYGDQFWGYYSKSIKQLYVTYEYKHIEVDMMAAHVQPSIVFERVESYYRTHDYRRIEFHIDETDIPYDYQLTYNEVDSLYRSHFNHIGQNRWAWGLIGHYVDGAWGWAQFTYERFVIGDQTSLEFLSGSVSTENKRVWVLTHEFGHIEHMIDFTGYKADVYAEKQYGFNYIDWHTPHYAASSWHYRLIWVCNIW